MIGKPSYLLFVGADNETGIVDERKLVNILTANHTGFTLWHAHGYWENEQEPSVVVMIADEPAAVERTITDIKRKLRQYAVGIIALPAFSAV